LRTCRQITSSDAGGSRHPRILIRCRARSIDWTRPRFFAFCLTRFRAPPINWTCPRFFAPETRKIIFDPIPRTGGLDPSDDPLWNLRADIYLLCGRRRRKASGL
jgi:hypothetical protein